MITSLVPVWLAQAAPTTEELKTQIDLSANILLETFYFWTVVVMWLIHVGFMAYEAGAARRKNLMSTAMKNILTIAVVTPTFYYFGWYIYGCFEPGLPTIGPDSLDGHAGPPQFPGFCGQTAPVGRRDGPEPPEPPERSLLPRVPPLLLDDRLDHVRSAHRARAALRVPHPHGDPRLVRVDHGRGLGLERRRLADHPLRLPRRDRVGRRPRRGRASSRSASSSISGRASGSTRRTAWRAASEGTTRTSR